MILLLHFNYLDLADGFKYDFFFIELSILVAQFDKKRSAPASHVLHFVPPSTTNLEFKSTNHVLYQ